MIVTYYTQRGQHRVYQTKSLTTFHEHLRKHLEGRTYEAPETAKLFFCPGVPLQQPFPYIREVK